MFREFFVNVKMYFLDFSNGVDFVNSIFV